MAAQERVKGGWIAGIGSISLVVSFPIVTTVKCGRSSLTWSLTVVRPGGFSDLTLLRFAGFPKFKREYRIDCLPKQDWHDRHFTTDAIKPT